MADKRRKPKFAVGTAVRYIVGADEWEGVVRDRTFGSILVERLVPHVAWYSRYDFRRVQPRRKAATPC
jgi:hypothetical protein